jgi:hypothetical protein
MVRDIDKVKEVLEQVAVSGSEMDLEAVAMQIIRIIHEPGPKRGIFI